MCLAVPAKVVEIVDEENQIAKVDIGGVRRNISVALLEDVKVGDWVLVHVGFAIQKVDEEEAAQTLALLKGLGQDLEDEFLATLPGDDEKGYP
ncbi:HypC/HybG/HupF family hydrogenase formation chaperone [Fervidibacter sacchari]|uniref:Hydrogenase expression/formation protein HypC n=1 Tax=Candidatus Fervidibacter sacchari TaxID=1448929 RepID=A0ABT2EPL2_9BACT|nr:HypC/HybG/HupF family hydrogenase formation chaperone [Candidatus Fervidibacter sacchari]MCS3918838.1 hydrogenase expression/formation protein HypC [Candidatus Fervidibacter sacchari]WKU17416.1 HypC/HybG/HupF family hydrogenase formation chaperone [Candidatus Fervidibacter sacchari]